MENTSSTDKPDTRRTRHLPAVAISTVTLGIGIYAAATGLQPSNHQTNTTSKFVNAAALATTSTTVASTTTSSTTLTNIQNSGAFAGTDWASLQYPVDCGGQTTGSVLSYANPEPGLNLAVVAVSCVAKAGTPPSAILVYDNSGPQNTAHLRQVLLSYQDDWLPDKSNIKASGTTISLGIFGYSTSDIPRCCPDIHSTMRWVWSGGTYTQVGAEIAHKVLPTPPK